MASIVLTALLAGGCASTASGELGPDGAPDLSGGSSALVRGGEVVDEVGEFFKDVSYRLKGLRGEEERKILQAELNNQLHEITTARDQLLATLSPEEAQLLRKYAIAKLDKVGHELVEQSNKLYAPKDEAAGAAPSEGCTSCVRMWGGFCHRRCCVEEGPADERAYRGSGLAEGEWSCSDCKQSCESCP